MKAAIIYSEIMISKYIAVHKKYVSLQKRVILIDKILSTLHVIIMNDNNPKGYAVLSDHDRMNAAEIERYIRREMFKKSNLELYFVENEELLWMIYRFLSMYLLSDNIVYYEFDDENLPNSDELAHTKYIKKEVWLEELYELVEHLYDILYSFDYDYEEMKIEGKKKFNELRKYVGNPGRIERMASIYNMDFCEYLERIDL